MLVKCGSILSYWRPTCGAGIQNFQGLSSFTLYLSRNIFILIMATLVKVHKKKRRAVYL